MADKDREDRAKKWEDWINGGDQRRRSRSACRPMPGGGDPGFGRPAAAAGPAHRRS